MKRPQPGNYSSQVLDSIRQMEEGTYVSNTNLHDYIQSTAGTMGLEDKYYVNMSKEELEEVVQDLLPVSKGLGDIIQRATKFWIQNTEAVLGTEFKGFKYPEGTRLPYRTMVLEYRFPDWAYTVPIKDIERDVHQSLAVRRLIILIEDEKDPQQGFGVFVWWYNEKAGVWTPLSCYASLEYAKITQYLEYMEAIPGMDLADPPYVLHDIATGDPEPRANIRHSNVSIIDEMKVALRFLALLSCRNLVEETIEAPAKLNRKRERQGKSLIPPYKYLSVPVKDRAVRNTSGGTHASPITHIRRGHIRRLQKGNIWINSMIVNPGHGEACDLYYI